MSHTIDEPLISTGVVTPAPGPVRDHGGPYDAYAVGAEAWLDEYGAREVRPGLALRHMLEEGVAAVASVVEGWPEVAIGTTEDGLVVAAPPGTVLGVSGSLRVRDLGASDHDETIYVAYALARLARAWATDRAMMLSAVTALEGACRRMRRYLEVG